MGLLGEKYENPAVSVDVLVFTVLEEKLNLLLIERAVEPYVGRWAIPGGFLGQTETAEETAARKLLERTGVANPHLEQLCTISTLSRDPRMRVVTIAYLALIPFNQLRFNPGVGAKSIDLFAVEREEDGITLVRKEDGERLRASSLAFDHGDILAAALERLAGKADYTDIAFCLLEDREAFTLVELQQIYEAILGTKLDPGNFRRDIRRRYEQTGRITPTSKKERTGGRGPRANVYRYTAGGKT